MTFRVVALQATVVTIPLLLIVIANDKSYAPLPILAAISSVPAFLYLWAWSRSRRIPALRTMMMFLVSFVCLMTMFFAGGQLLKLDIPVLVPFAYVVLCVGTYWAVLTYLNRLLE